jgi:hypothetical protein
MIICGYKVRLVPLNFAKNWNDREVGLMYPSLEVIFLATARDPAN